MRPYLALLVLPFALSLYSGEGETVKAAAGNKTSPAPNCPDCEKPVVSLLGGVATVTPWLEPEKRTKKVNLDYVVSDQAGKDCKLSSLNDRPMAITFLYTRCTNKNKCPLAATTMGALHESVLRQGLQDKVRLSIVTYDPEYDTPQRLKRYGEQKNIKFDDCIRMLRPAVEAKDSVFKDLDIAVNYSEGMVNIHGLQIVLVDKNGRFVRSYHTVIWDNIKVLEDLKKLASE